MTSSLLFSGQSSSHRSSERIVHLQPNEMGTNSSHIIIVILYIYYILYYLYVYSGQTDAWCVKISALFLREVLARRIADALIYVADDPVVYLSGARQLSLFIMRYHELMWCSPHQSLELQLMLPGNSVQLDNQKMCCIF